MLKKVAIALAVLLLVAGSVVAYLWTRATALPDWYTEGEGDLYAGDPIDSDGPAAAPRWIALDEQGNRLPGDDPIPLAPPFDPQSKGEPTAEHAPGSTPVPPAPSRSAPPRSTRRSRPAASRAQRHELRGFHVRRGKDGKRKRNPALRASRAVYEDGRLEVGVILDLSRLPQDKLRARDRQRYDQAVANFPGITKRDVWVGVEDEPLSVGGYLQLSPQAEVRVGTLTYSLASAAERLGMSEMEMRLELNRELRRLGFVDPEA
ncbi:MAG: hypothetical protein AAGF11_12040 [Myxococcota bacterium]